MRQCMVGSISHELRTPLNCVQSLLKSSASIIDESSQLYKEFILPSIHQSNYLLYLINDILAYTQISFNKDYRMVYENFNLRNLVDEIISMMQQRAILRKIKLIAEIEDDVPKIFCSEPRRFKQILINLIGNSIKFTFKGYVKLIIKVDNKEKNYLKVSVIDTGLGIKKENINKLFKMFGMLEDSKKEN